MLLGINQHLEASSRQKSQKMDWQVEVSESLWGDVRLWAAQQSMEPGESVRTAENWWKHKAGISKQCSLLSSEMFLPRQGVYHRELDRTLLTELQLQPKYGVHFTPSWG